MSSLLFALFFLVAAVVRVSALPFSPYPLWGVDAGYPIGQVVLNNDGNALCVVPRTRGGSGRTPFNLLVISTETGQINFNISSTSNGTQPPRRDPQGSCAFSGTTPTSVSTTLNRHHDKTNAFASSSTTHSVAVVGFSGETTVYAFDAVSGSFRWSYNFSSPSAFHGKEIDWVSGGVGLVFVALRDSIECLSGEDGKWLWSHPMQYNDGDQNMRQMSIWDNRVGVLVSQGMAVGIDVYNGGSLWSSRGNAANGWTTNFYGSAVLSPDGVVTVQGLSTSPQLLSNNATIAALNANNGQTLFQEIFVGEEVGTAPAGGSGVSVFNPDIQIAAPFNYVTCFNATTGKQLWQTGYLWYVASITVGGSSVFVTSVPQESEYSAVLTAYEASSGAKQWEVPSPFSREPAVFSGKVLYGGGGEYSASTQTVTAMQVFP